ncbi:hypothetical protein IWQ57_005227, partial [Coemansia nantahalensis]
MRKSGARPATVKPAGAAQGAPQESAAAGRVGFSGLKIQSAPKPTSKVNGRPSAFGDGAPSRASAAAGSIGVEMALVEAQQGSTILGQGEREANAPLVIPARRNADWMKRRGPAPGGSATAAAQLREEAISELIGGETQARRELVIPSRSQAGREERAFADDIGECSDVSDDAYERVPVEEFGAAMLRGMGWTGD